MLAYNLGFGPDVGALRTGHDHDDAVIHLVEPVLGGWSGSAGPALGSAWPRGPLTGLPMMHAITLWLPPDYRRRRLATSAEIVAVSFFQGEGQFAETDDAVAEARTEHRTSSTDPFLVDLTASTVHPRFEARTDVIDGAFGLIWLTQDELDRGPTAPPPDVRRPGTWMSTDEGANAWDDVHPTVSVWLGVRDDPNTGLAPVDLAAEDNDIGGYRPPFDDESQFELWAEPLVGISHLGGTSFPEQALPDGLTPFYLELHEIAGLNFGTGNAQIDLESDTFDWACG